MRRESRKLENEIDGKLVSFSKLSSTYNKKDYERSDLESTGNSDKVFDTMVMEIEQLLEELRVVNGNMNDYVSKLNGVATPGTLYHTLQRHNDILQDYSQEYNKTKDNVQSIRQREELLGSTKRDPG